MTMVFSKANSLEQAAYSRLKKEYTFAEYIVVDAGFTDGSHEPYEGSADRLNKGFALIDADGCR